MARHIYDPWAKKSKAGMRSLGKMIDVGIKVGKAVAKSSSSSRSHRSYPSSSYGNYSVGGYSASSYSYLDAKEQRRIEKERERIANESKCQSMQDESDLVVMTIKLVEKVIDPSILQHKLQCMRKPSPYARKPFPEDAPTMEGVELELRAEAAQKISSILFWHNKRLREEYVEKSRENALSLKLVKWNEKRIEWEKQQDDIETKINEDRKYKYEREKHDLEMYFSSDNEEICDGIEVAVSSVSLPYTVKSSFNYNAKGHTVILKINYPGKEIIPLEKGTILASGKLSVKQKTVRELNFEYSSSVLGSGYALASAIFNSARAIEKIVIYGYTVPVLAMNEDTCCIYAVSFDRDTFSSRVSPDESPAELIQLFPHNIKISSSGEMKNVYPEVPTM